MTRRLLRGPSSDPTWARPGLLALLTASAAAHLRALDASGYGHEYYAASTPALRRRGASHPPPTLMVARHPERKCRMDLNLVVLAGRLAAPPEIRQFESGTRLARYLVTVRTEEPNRRVDVVPVSLWDPDDALVDADPAPGTRVWVAGAVQRRFWSGDDGRRSRIEVVAEQVCLRDADPDEG